MTDSLNILLIDDSPDDREFLARLLSKAEDRSFEVTEAESGATGMTALRAARFDCVLLDFSMPQDDGLTVLREVVLRFPEVPIVMMTGLGNERVAVDALKSGAQDYIQKSDLSTEAVINAISQAVETKQQEAEIIRRANYDELTGLANRRLFDDRLDRALARTGRSMVFAVIFFDLNGFKPVNDTYGHAAGDKILKGVAERTGEVLRSGDTVARLGGDEFVVLLEDLPGDGAAAINSIEKRILDRVCGAPFDVDGNSLSVGLSLGSAIYPSTATTRADLLRIADERMYRMKAESKGEQRSQLRTIT